jgi:hypothetical protein
MWLSERGLERSAKTNLILGLEILGLDTGDGFKDGIEGSKCSGWRLREFDYKCGTPESLVNPTSLLN